MGTSVTALRTENLPTRGPASPERSQRAAGRARRPLHPCHNQAEPRSAAPLKFVPPVHLASPAFHFLIGPSTSSQESMCCAPSTAALAFFSAPGCLIMADGSASYLRRSIYSLLFVPPKSLTGLQGRHSETRSRDSLRQYHVLILCSADFRELFAIPAQPSLWGEPLFDVP